MQSNSQGLWNNTWQICKNMILYSCRWGKVKSLTWLRQGEGRCCNSTLCNLNSSVEVPNTCLQPESRQRGSVKSKTSHVSLVAFSELDGNRDFGCTALSARKTATSEVSLAFSLCKVAGIKTWGSRFCSNIQMKKAVRNVRLFFF